MAPKNKQRDPYTYTKLNDLREGFKFNVYGILVEVIKNSVPANSGILHSIFKIRDESLPSDRLFQMHCFIRSDRLPNFTVGDILRFHRVKVEPWNGEFDGRIFNATDVVSFSSDEKSGFRYTTLAETITLSDQDKERILELREIAVLDTLFQSSGESGNNATIMSRDMPINKETNGVANPSPNQPGPSNKKLIEEKTKETPAMSSLKYLSNPAAHPCMSKRLLPNPFHHQKQQIPETDVSPAIKRKSVEQDTSGAETETQENIADNITVRKKQRPCPRSKKKMYNEEVSSSNKEVDLNEISTAVLKKGLNSGTEMPNEQNEVPSSLETDISSTCPGVLCAGENCGQAPVLVDSNAGRSEIERLSSDTIGEIPAVDEEGNVLIRKHKYMNYEAEDKHTYINAHFMKNFEWPCYSVKVRITKIKPSLQVLKSNGPKNLLSGVCKRCGTFSYYSHLIWSVNKASSTKKPLCPLCKESDVTSEIHLEFRLQLTVMDAWGTNQNIYVIREKAAEFLGCSQAEYQRSDEIRQKTFTLLSKALSCKRFFTVCLYCVNSMTKKLIYVKNTKLSEALQSVSK